MALPLSKNSDRYFFLGSALFFLLVNVIGFSTSLNSRHESEGILPIHIYIHGVFSGLWILLYFLQNLVVTLGKMKWHFFLGRFALLVMAGILISGFYTAFRIPTLYYDEIPESLEQPGRDFVGFVVAAFLVAFALSKRKVPFVHKRLMLLGTLALSGAGMARFIRFFIPEPSIPLIISSLYFPVICMIIYDMLTYRKLYKIHAGGLACISILFVTAAPPFWNNGVMKPVITSLVTWVSQL